MKPVNSTYKILLNKALNRSIDESSVEWAIDMIEAGFESENLYMLAGVIKPYNQFELLELMTKVLDDLNLEYKNRDHSIKRYVYFLISTVIDHPDKYYLVLRELRDICREMDFDKAYYDFNFLYYAKDDLMNSDVQWYWDGANRENIDCIIREQFAKWKEQFEHEFV